ncbi:cysteine desulfurase/selenocysteine lyase [Motilibacter peucedani]|uniref:Cysteine desulfurase n=1 Tax=Motilibacter peucedani TaxID=598650 RepID=A0A420XV73_9ACTN|nr:cysteine desulfurase [Motilibacter peucedani]RKS84188.1 cysteine desulfurase/selenocysteine lyase [Motilibacter peucedani]
MTADVQRVAPAVLDAEAVRADFPILSRTVHDADGSGGRPLVYLDSAATSQKPQVVLDALDSYYRRSNANVHRGVHALAEEATALYEGARDKLVSFIGAASRSEVVFTKNSTEALNLVANVVAWGSRWRVGPGDEVLVTEMEHHSNIVPWQLLCERTGATLRWIGLTDEGRLDLSNLDELLTERTKVVSLVHVSNILGTVNPVAEVARRAKQVSGALVVVDGSQAVPQLPYDVGALAADGVDLVAFTGHKMAGPTGIGVLWGREAVLAELPPFLGGGEMIETVKMAGSTYAALPHKFEAGTPPIAQAVGLGAAVDYLSGLGMDAVAAHEQRITAYALERLAEVPGLRVVGPGTMLERGGAVSFVMEGAGGPIHSHDVGQVLDAQGVAVRVGNHCARPVCDRFGVPATSRASFYAYSTTADVDALVDGLGVVRKWFA